MRTTRGTVPTDGSEGGPCPSRARAHLLATGTGTGTGHISVPVSVTGTSATPPSARREARIPEFHNDADSCSMLAVVGRRAGMLDT